MKQLNVSLSLVSKHQFSEYAEIKSCSLQSIELISDVAGYTLHLPFSDSSFEFDQQEDGCLRIILNAQDIDEDLFFEENAYTLDQADFASFVANDVELSNFETNDLYFQSELHSGVLTSSHFEWQSLSMKFVSNTAITATIKSVA